MKRYALALAMIALRGTAGLAVAQSTYNQNDPNATPSNPPATTSPSNPNVEPQDTYRDRTRSDTDVDVDVHKNATTSDRANDENMPRTASPMPLLGAIGGLLIGAALLLEVLSRRGAKAHGTDVSNR